MAIAGFSAKAKLTGTSTAFTNEACTEVTANTVYRITNAAKRIVDPTVAITVQTDPIADGTWGTIAAADYTFDYLFGTVTFSADQGGPALVRVSAGNYLPILAVAEVRSFEFSASRTVLETTTQDTTGAKTKLLGLGDIEGSAELLAHLLNDLDSGVGGIQSIHSFFLAGTPKVLEFRPGSGTTYFRAWVKFDGVKEKSEVDGLVTASVAFKGAAVAGVTKAAGASFGWGVGG